MARETFWRNVYPSCKPAWGRWSGKWRRQQAAPSASNGNSIIIVSISPSSTFSSFWYPCLIWSYVTKVIEKGMVGMADRSRSSNPCTTKSTTSRFRRKNLTFCQIRNNMLKISMSWVQTVIFLWYFFLHLIPSQVSFNWKLYSI